MAAMNPIDKSLRLALLIQKELRQELNADERLELERLREEDPAQDALFLDLTDSQVLESGLREIEQVDVEKGWARLQAAMAAAEPETVQRKARFHWAWAAAVVGTTALSGILWQQMSKDASTSIQTNAPEVVAISPGTDRAYLTLGDGTEILLDSTGDGMLAIQGAASVVKEGRGISYQGTGNTGESVINSIRTPRGGQYRLALSDGSVVWLNAASSLRFPASFAGNQRTVQLTGEAYFEVKPDAGRPFTVEVGDLRVGVTGTRFNVNAYADEKGILTTLAEGAVNVQSKGVSRALKAGQEILSDPDGRLQSVKTADLEAALAWKEGQFVFNGSDVPAIMRQISRWYDVDVTYSATARKETFTGMVSRKSDISRVLRIMEAGGIRFRIEKNSIMVE
jgi:ferric-dicitrate binding protein FerR (iron transport regulator)